MNTPNYRRGLTFGQAVTIAGGVGAICTAILGTVGVATKGKAWLDSHYVTVETYRDDRASYRAKRFADSVHHAADDQAEARVRQAIDSLRKRCRNGCTSIIQAGNAR